MAGFTHLRAWYEALVGLRVSPRILPFVGGGGVLCGLVLFTLGLVRQHVHCDRDEGACIIRASPVQPTETLQLDEIREHQFRLSGGGVLGQQAETILIDRAGRSISIAAGHHRAARRRYEAFTAFLSGATDEVELTSDLGWDWFMVGVTVFVFAGSWWQEQRDLQLGRRCRYSWRD